MQYIIQKLILAILTILVIAEYSQGQPYDVKRIGNIQGLSNNYVNSIAEDKNGYIWISTEEGLNRFDGNTFTNFYSNRGHHKLAGNELNHILDDPKDSIIWVATQRNGLNAYNYANNIMYHYPKGEISSEAVTDIAPSSDSSIWVATYWNGVNYFDKKTSKFRQYNSQNVSGISNDHIWAIADNGNGNVYIGYSEQGLAILDTTTKSLTYLRNDPNNKSSIPSNEVLCLRPDKYGNIWVGTSKGLAILSTQNNNFTRLDFIPEIAEHSVFDIRHTSDGYTWIALELGGIVITDIMQKNLNAPQSIQSVKINAGEAQGTLSGASVRCLHEDHYGNIWAGIWAGGVNFIAKEKNAFGYIDAATNFKGTCLTNKGVLSIAGNNNDYLYVGTDGGGINVFHNGIRIATYDSDNTPQIVSNSIQALYYDNNKLWVGMFNGGLTCMDTQTGKFQTVIKGTDSNADIRYISDTNTDTLLVATSGGICIVSKKKCKLLNRISLKQNLVRCILRDNKGYIWAGTFGGGLFIFDFQMNLIRELDTDVNFPSNTVNHIIQDSRNLIYVATGEGLIKFTSESDTAYRICDFAQGLSNIHIRAIAEDSLRNIWFSTNQGISCLRTNGQIVNFDNRNNICNGSYTSACVYSSSHILYFGSINGLSIIHPENALRYQTAPIPRITKIIIAPSSPQYSDSIILNPISQLNLQHWQNTIIFGINSSNYAFKTHTENECRLIGFDNKWIPVSNTSGTITFRNLPPGHYELQIRTRLHNQEWERNTPKISITINPPLWLTTWAKIGYLLLILAAIYALLYGYKHRVKMNALYQLEKNNREKDNYLNEERMKFYTNITHELRTPLTLILGPMEDIVNNNSLAPELASKARLIHRNALSLLEKVNALLEFRKTESANRKLVVSKANISNIVNDTALRYSQLATSHNVPIVLSIENTNNILLDKDALQTILNNLIFNAIKYTSNGSITIGVQTVQRNEHPYICITVADTGCGISEEALTHIFERYYQEHGEHQSSGTGIGLALVKNLADLHHAIIEVESKQGKGTVFRIYFDINETYPEAIHISETEDNNKKDESKPTSKSNNKLVLLVEDNLDILNYLSNEIGKYYDVDKAENGKKALETAFLRTPDIIVSDIMMPEMNGTELCKKIKNDIRTSHIPVILLTAKDSMDDKEFGYNVGADSYLTKPITATLLQSRINNLLEQRRKLAQRFVLTPNNLPHSTNIITDTLKQKHDSYISQLSKLDQEFIDKLNKVIDDNLSEEKLDTPFIASEMALSISTLYRKMKALTGITASDYIRKARMKKAEQLLLEGKYSISETAYMVGINSNVHFRQCFKDEFGMLPSEYIKQIKKE